MSAHFRKAITSEAKPLVGLYSESGCGKTRSALLIAKGFTGDMSRVGMIETESGRGEAYADDPIVGGYNVLSIREEFSPTTYGKAISAAEQANLRCLIVDSASHEWEGVNGVLAMAAENQAAGKKGPLVWQLPKTQHAREFMLRLTQTPIPLVIVCMRAKYPMVEVTKDGKKEWARSKDLSPKQSEDILFEMFIHGWIDQEHNFHGTKYTLDVLRKVFIDGERITVDTGARLAQWAAGGTNKAGVVEMVDTAGLKPVGTQPAGSSPAPGTFFINANQAADLDVMLTDAGIPRGKLLEKMCVAKMSDITEAQFQRAIDWIARVVEARKERA